MKSIKAMTMLNEHDQASAHTNASVPEPLTEAEAALRLGLKVPTLRAWRHQGRGPAFVRLGRAVRYLVADIDEFLTANRHTPRSLDNM
jgi:excisionase family DNA binding protein